jgi:hypothetical protein
LLAGRRIGTGEGELRVMAVTGMRIRSWLVGASAVAVLAAAVSGGSPAVASGPGRLAGTWGLARQVPVPQNQLGSVTCARGGYCVAVAGPDVLIARDGVWARPHPLDLSALGSYQYPALDVVACPSARNCVAAGHYTPVKPGTSLEPEPFVVSQIHGQWGPAQPLAVLSDDPSTDPVTKPVSLACSSPGNCAISVIQSNTNYEFDGSFVAAERNGTWEPARYGPVAPQLACTPGYCIGPLLYAPNSAIIERGGTWTIHTIPGLAPSGEPLLVSCAPDRTCTIAGHEPTLPENPIFSISDRNGTWGKARIIPVTHPRFGYNPTALSCPAAGDCTLGGFTVDPAGGGPFTAAQRNGAWARPHTIPGITALDKPPYANVAVLYCPALGQCAAGGYGAVPPGDVISQGYLATETNGRWGKAVIVPGISTLEQGGQGPSQLYTIACWAPAHCIGGGYYYSRNPFTQYPFVITEH